MRHAYQLIFSALLALASITAANAETAVSRAGRQAAKPLASTAAAANTEAQDTAVQGDAKATVNASVTRGVELTRRALTTTNPAEKAASLREAEMIYTDVVKANPKSGAALNNLAVLAAGKGDSTAARQYFESAIASDDGHKALYALNYSKFLQTTDQPAAIHQARLAVQAAPSSTVAKEHLGALLWQTNPAEMLPLAHNLASQGYSELATRFALQCLTSQSRPEAERRAWLILLATRLSREYAISEEVRRSLADDLAKLESDPMIGLASKQLRAVINAPPKSTTDVSWWANQTSPPLKGNITGREAMRDVLLAAGEAHSRQDVNRAEQYLRTAIDLGNRGADPDAFLRLVELYASSDDTAQLTNARRRIATLMDRYQFELFSEKSQAYSEGNWPLIYRMHVALGMTYAYLKIWTSSTEYQNAIFQLSNAMKAAERANTDPRRKPTDQLLALPPVGVEKLAESYMAIGKKNLALQTRVEGAVVLNRIGYVRDSVDVFRSIPTGDTATLDAASRAKYEELRTKLPET